MLKHSPFAVATATAPVGSAPDFAKDLYVANAAHTAGGDFVTIASTTDKNLKEYLTTQGPNDHGYGIAAIEWADTPGGTKVTISKDGQFATIGFNEAVMTQGPQPIQPQPFTPNMPAAGVKPQPPPQPPLPAPHVRGLIQRSRQPAAASPAPVPNAAPLEAPDS